METGIEKIIRERQEQISKHGFTTQEDVINNPDEQLIEATFLLIVHESTFINPESLTPKGWSRELWVKMRNKSDIERYAIAGALLAAEIDRLQFLKEGK